MVSIPRQVHMCIILFQVFIRKHTHFSVGYADVIGETICSARLVPIEFVYAGLLVTFAYIASEIFSQTVALPCVSPPVTILL